ncbi:MAG: transcriptional repressor LexA [Clostridiales bacterium]|nr:transcriptional repressor LexA [Clostridiales bacterium]
MATTPLKGESKSERSIDRVYSYVKQYIHENALSPSVRDICKGAGLKSTSSVHAYLKKLDELGMIEYRPGMRRAIILKNSEQSSDEPSSVSGSRADVVRLPCLGKITAGIPIYAHEDHSESFYVSRSIIGSDECFLLKVSGTSMINAHILDGDYLIVRKQNSCNEGDIIAALIDDEATVKRYGKMNGQPYLFPENDLFSPIPFNTEGCKILGKVIGLHRYSIS